MKRMCLTLLSCGLVSISPIASAGPKGQVDPPLHYTVPGTTVIIRKGQGPVQLNPYPDLTYLHDPITVNCASARGCVIIAQMYVRDVQPYNICTYLDGEVIRPDCSYLATNNGNDDALQSQHVGQGAHTLQAAIASGNTTEDTAGAWNVVYTIYDDGKV